MGKKILLIQGMFQAILSHLRHTFFSDFSGQIWASKAGHMVTMVKKLIFEVKIVAKWPETGQNRVAAAWNRGELNH